jgi:hypothetical protein
MFATKVPDYKTKLRMNNNTLTFIRQLAKDKRFVMNEDLGETTEMIEKKDLFSNFLERVHKFLIKHFRVLTSKYDH